MPWCAPCTGPADHPMPVMTFESTLPMGAAELMRASAFRRTIDDDRRADDDRITSRLSSLDPSLHQDLLRFEQKGRQSELLEVMAGAVRHSSAVTVHLQLHEHVLALTVFPVHRLVHCVLPMAQFFDLQLTDLEVLRVEKAHMQVPDLQTLAKSRAGAVRAAGQAAVGAVAARLARRTAARDRRPGGLPHHAHAGPVGAGTHRLAGLGLRQAASARPPACARSPSGPASTASARMRMLNGLYLQAGLMVSRTHPAATNDGWFSGSR
jgi:hypothetical protein